jgi:hypothetical protein
MNNEKIHGIAIILCPTYAEKVTNTVFICGRMIKIKLLVQGKEMNYLEIHTH